MEFIKAIIGKIHTLGKGLFTLLMATTAWMAYTTCDRLLGGSTTLPSLYESILVVVAAMVVTMLIDDGLHKNAVASMAHTIKHGGIWKIRKKGGFVMLGLMALTCTRFFFSGGATYLTGETTVVSKEVESEAYDKTKRLEDKKEAALAKIRRSRKSSRRFVLS